MTRLKKREIEEMFGRLENPLSEFIGDLDVYKSKYYNSVMYNGESPVFALSGGQLYYNRDFFRFFLESGMSEKLFGKVIELWFEKKYSVPIGYVGWSESFEKEFDS